MQSLTKRLMDYYKYYYHNEKEFWENLGGDSYFEAFHTDKSRNEDIFTHYIDIYKPKSLIDIGCGYGRYLKVISEKYPEISLYGVDIAESQIKKAKEYLDNESIILSVANGTHLPFEEKVFDMAITYGCFSAVKKRDINPFFQEIIRTTRDVGVFIEAYHPNNKSILNNNHYWYRHNYDKLFSNYIFSIKNLDSKDDTLFIVQLGE